MNESIKEQAILIKELVAENLQLDYNQQLSYPEIFKSAYQSNSELFDAPLPFEDLGLANYFNAAAREIVDNINVSGFSHVSDVYNWVQVCDYQIKVWNMHGNMLVNDQTYYSVDLHNVDISTYHYSGVTLVEIEAINDEYAGMDADAYTEEQVEQFRDILYTMRQDDVAGWCRSLQLRKIEIPDAIKDEIFLIVGERRGNNVK